MTAPTFSGASGRRRSVNGPLRKHPTNPHYFTDETGKAIYLVGTGIHGTFQKSYAEPDYPAYLTSMGYYHHNLHRMRVWEMGWVLGIPKPLVPWRYERTGPGLATDGGPKFDLTRFSEEFFTLLRERVVEALEKGIYVVVILLQGQTGRDERPDQNRSFWGGHPFHRDNNINGVDGDLDGDGQGLEVHTLDIPVIVRHQEAYVRKVVETLNDLDNVIYEIGNELHNGSVGFSYHMVEFIRKCEEKLPRRHPVGITAMGDWGPPLKGRAAPHATLTESPADWISPSGNWEEDPPVEARKIVLLDTDHTLGWGLPPVAWVWKSFARGHNLILMDRPDKPDTKNRDIYVLEAIRRNMGYALRYAERMDLAAMRPLSDLSSTTYCLASPSSEYLVYQPEHAEFSVALEAGSYSAEWLSPTSGQRVLVGSFTTRGGERSFRAPFAGEAVLYMQAKDG